MSLKLAKPTCFPLSSKQRAYAGAYKALLKKRLEIASKLFCKEPVKNTKIVIDFIGTALSMHMSTESHKTANIMAAAIEEQLRRAHEQMKEQLEHMSKKFKAN